MDLNYLLIKYFKLKMMDLTEFITLTAENIEKEHICCAFSDKKCAESYALKKDWLRNEFKNGYVFRRLNARAKVFIEYGPAEKAWVPVQGPGYLIINCMWVSGQYKGKGYAKALLESALDEAHAEKKEGLTTVVGSKKLPFMGDLKWFQRQGFEVCQKLPNGFYLLVRKIRPEAPDPTFKESVLRGECLDKEGLVVYYSNRCPYAEFHAKVSLPETAAKRGLPVKLIKLETREQAQNAPTPAAIFSLFYQGKFITTDLSVCMENRFEKFIKL